MVAPGTDFNAMGLNEPKFKVFTWSDVLTNLALNLMMLASGIGLVTRKPWGISLGLWTAGFPSTPRRQRDDAPCPPALGEFDRE